MKKFLSFIIALMLVFSTMMIAPLGASAAELDPDKIYVKIENRYYEVKTGDVITYRFDVDYADSKITALDVHVPYNGSALKLIPSVDEYGDVDLNAMFPKFSESTFYNFNYENEILFNCVDLNGVRLTPEDGTVFCADFEVITDEPGVYEINGYVYTLASFNTRIIVNGNKYLDFGSGAVIEDITPIVIEEEVPDPTVQPTVEPTDAPTEELTETPTVPETLEPTVEPDPIVPTGPGGTAPPETQEPTYEGIYVRLDGELYPVQPGDVVTYTYYIGYDGANRISSLDVLVTYDSDGLVFVPDIDEYGDEDPTVMFPATGATTVFNLKNAGSILFNYSSVRGIRLKLDKDPVFVGKFKVITDKPGIYNIGSEIRVLADSEMNKIVYYGNVTGEYAEVHEVTDVVAGPFEEPTEPSVEPTNPPTPEPTPEEIPEETPEPTPEEIPVETPEPTPEQTPEETPEPTDPPTDEPTDDGNEDWDDPIAPPPTEPINPPTVEPTNPPTVEPKDEPTDEPIEPPVSEILIGDMDGNGKIEVFDATLIQRYLARYEELTDEQMIIGDTNFDGIIEVFDATIIQRLLAKYITEIKPVT